MKLLTLNSVMAALLAYLIATAPAFAQSSLTVKFSRLKGTKAIAPSIVTTIRDHASEFDPPGSVLRHVDKSAALFVTSARNQLLFQYRYARAAKAENVPPAMALKDVVIVQCGDADLGEKRDLITRHINLFK